MARPKGSPKLGGRQKGTPNKATAAIRDLAREYTDDALKTLAEVMRQGDTDAARVSAAKELLDRGYGKATTVLAGDEDGGPIAITRIELFGVTPGDNG